MRDGEPSDLILSEVHNERSIVPSMTAACGDIEQQILAIEQETAEALEDIKQTVGNLSDLRYGRLPKVAGSEDSLAEETIDALRRLEQVAQDAKER
jgi:centromere-localized protein 2